VNSRIFGCRKFRRLSHEQADRELTSPERLFMRRHRDVCMECAKSERNARMALDMLRAASLEPQVAQGFDERVIRIVRVRRVGESLGYWSPAIAGAAIACIAIFASLQLVSQPLDGGPSGTPVGEARLDRPVEFPDLELDQNAPFLR
jgi:hypothetical protein